MKVLGKLSLFFLPLLQAKLIFASFRADSLAAIHVIDQVLQSIGSQALLLLLQISLEFPSLSQGQILTSFALWGSFL